MHNSFEQIKQITSQINGLLDMFSPPKSNEFTKSESNGSNKMIYVLELENRNYFIYVSEKLSDYKILINCEIYYDFTKKFKPLRIIERIPLTDEFQIDTIVKTYMNLYGYAYVRGGSYSNDPLTPNQESIIQQELDYIEDGEKYEYCFSQILEYQNRYYDSIEEIDSLISKTTTNYTNYLKDKSRYDQLFPKEYKTTVNNIIPEDIDWLYDICVLLRDNGLDSRKNIVKKKTTDFSSIYIQKYQSLIEVFKHIYFLLETTNFFDNLSLNNSEEFGEIKLYLKYPQFLFDQFFYHSATYEITAKSLDTVSQICLILKTMIIISHNRIDEYRYDMNTYDRWIEWTYPREIYILEKKRREFNEINRQIDVD